MRHNKKRNTALLYEFLLRHVVRSTIDSKQEESNKAVAVIKKYFKAGPLAEEWQIFDAVFKSKMETQEYAGKILREAKIAAKKIDTKKLDTEKTRLIKEISKLFETKEFYSYKIPNYTAFASLQSLLNDESGMKKIGTEVDRIRLEESLVQFMTSERDETKQVLKANPEYNNLVCRIAAKKFNEKYQDILSPSQRHLLMRYSVSEVQNSTHAFIKHVSKVVSEIKESLSFIKDNEIIKDKDLCNKLNECRGKLSRFDASDTSKENIVRLLRFMSLSDEVSK